MEHEADRSQPVPRLEICGALSGHLHMIIGFVLSARSDPPPQRYSSGTPSPRGNKVWPV
jgi:hypothetical protein